LIPAIGIMIACYIIVRMAAFATRDGERAESGLVRVLAVITILVATWAIVVLLRGGDPGSGLLGATGVSPATGAEEVMTSYDHTMQAHQLLMSMPPANGTNSDQIKEIMAKVEFHQREAERLEALGR
jgi:hypothetical protein